MKSEQIEPAPHGVTPAGAPRSSFQPEKQAAGPAPAPEAELLGVLRRMNAAVEDMRARFETLTRERRHREFSPGRLVGAGVQFVALVFVILALKDWAFGANEGPILVKLAFAAVFQLGALTGFVLGRRPN